MIWLLLLATGLIGFAVGCAYRYGYSRGHTAVRQAITEALTDEIDEPPVCTCTGTAGTPHDDGCPFLRWWDGLSCESSDL